MRIIWSLLLVAAIELSIATALANDTRFMEQISGQYEGTLLSGGGFAPVTTYFKAIQPSSLDGYYIYTEPSNKKLGGEITDCATIAPLEVSCLWHDQYGSGRVVFSFTKDHRSFQGRWSPQSQSRWFPWNGTRK